MISNEMISQHTELARAIAVNDRAAVRHYANAIAAIDRPIAIPTNAIDRMFDRTIGRMIDRCIDAADRWYRSQ